MLVYSGLLLNFHQKAKAVNSLKGCKKRIAKGIKEKMSKHLKQ